MTHFTTGVVFLDLAPPACTLSVSGRDRHRPDYGDVADEGPRREISPLPTQIDNTRSQSRGCRDPLRKARALKLDTRKRLG